MICTGCGKETFKARVIPGKGDFCKECAPIARAVPHAVFPYTITTLVPGKEITANSLHHLRQLCKEHQVSCVAFEQDAKNFDSPPQTDFSKITPWLHGKERIYPHTEHSIALERRMADARRARR